MSSLSDVPFGLAVTNATSGDTVLEAGVTTSLTISVVNNTGASIALVTGAGASAFGVYLPTPALFSTGQLNAIKVTTPGWSGAPPASDSGINITCTETGTWANGQTLTFTLANVTSSGPPASGTVTLEPANLGDDAPLSIYDDLSVVNPPKPGNLQLTDVLQVTLDNQGTVLRSSSAADPLSNTLYLTLKNTGAAPLAVGGQRFGNPRVLVSFVYGNTSGALAPDTYNQQKGPQLGTAWTIKSGISSAQLPWTATDPRPDSQDHDPQWTLTPSPSNMTLLGAASTDQANVTFSFSDIVTFAPTGHTQLLVLCTGFARDAQTNYDDHLFVLDIAKLDPPPTRGLLSFSGSDPVVSIANPNTQITIPLRWAMYDVGKIQLLSSSQVVPPQNKTYPVPLKPVDYDSTTVTVPAPPGSQAIFFTLQSFDGGGTYLNSQQFTVYAQVSYLQDVAGHVYPIALFGNTFWMLANYQFNAAGSYDYASNPANEAAFGKLYDSQVLSQPPAGWQVPTLADWNALFGLFGDAKAAYAALIGGGRSGFNAALGGRRSIQPGGAGLFEQQYQNGYYWASGGVCAQFSGISQQASAGSPVTNLATALSVRFIRHA
jgi:uncharacterized protein (TIGR02145 family)